MAGPNKPLANVVYRSLGQLSPEIKHLTALCINRGLLDKSAGESIATSFRDRSCPFIVIEGMDGTGKTTLTKCLASKLNMKQISTPPKLPEFQQARPFFDNQPESLRRAYYSLGNYLAAQDVVDCKGPVVMDRFWHSTAAYAMAHQIKTLGEQPKSEDFIWPDDLLKPDLVIFLQVSEQERIRRHTNRKDFTNTAEEQTLADNESFRNSLTEIYRKIAGPKFLELNVDGEQPLVEDKILKTVIEHFPMLEYAEKQTGMHC
ncbi:UMP-CMP kinase 2, mitochondrial-like isoform X2 [Folsomia candida]|uniref:UMP-CMP kinase 2, mitochondrial-like isoform X2 n=1 Tax=Folsomia candida TaxID=158441 RepID=UPI0016050864|nr:UMP-CMP kinase 2, mitochondrial-like isoform X2 [Folsomia candida]